MGHYENNNLLEKETGGRKYLIERERNGERGKWGGEKKWLVRGEILGGGGVWMCAEERNGKEVEESVIWGKKKGEGGWTCVVGKFWRKNKSGDD